MTDSVRTAGVSGAGSLGLGAQILEWADQLAGHSDQADGLTVAYLTRAHQTAAAEIAGWMIEAGMQVEIDAVGNVVGRYPAQDPAAKVLLTGSHFDTVRNGGKYDGRLGILLPIAVVKRLHEHGIRLPYHVDVVAFAEEEGLRFHSSFLASSALIGAFDRAWLDAVDEDGVTMRDAMRAAGLAGTEDAIFALRRDPSRIAAFMEVHIEQGPVLLERGLPLGVVTSIAGSVRMTASVIGQASHAGTTPMNMRRDAAAAAAEMTLAIESRCAQAPSLVGTVGMFNVPNGATNVVPGRCDFSIDIRAGDDATRDEAVVDVLRVCEAIAQRRGVAMTFARTMAVPSAPCAAPLMDLLAASLERVGVPHFRLPSGAGHDAMMLARITDACMLFVRCGNGGISHNPLETVAADDVDLAGLVFLDFLRNFSA
ncbi:MAG TPA: allantoate amidohydrolase [Burkholderiaceae bacterium]|nr:allantoate amidohydrolase [Burkholderiaceae bacterium]